MITDPESGQRDQVLKKERRAFYDMFLRNMQKHVPIIQHHKLDAKTGKPLERDRYSGSFDNISQNRHTIFELFSALMGVVDSELDFMLHRALGEVDERSGNGGELAITPEYDELAMLWVCMDTPV
eukprot:GHVU01107040.1.p1 GENE.GHVU01107040.1~~GHVU01107040.1.p1  ORF type:complete len:125 (+),score=10.48 GHVU01107040.1:318-692(+)